LFPALNKYKLSVADSLDFNKFHVSVLIDIRFHIFQPALPDGAALGPDGFGHSRAVL
jgi:hypothetical protein